MAPRFVRPRALGRRRFPIGLGCKGILTFVALALTLVPWRMGVAAPPSVGKSIVTTISDEVSDHDVPQAAPIMAPLPEEIRPPDVVGFEEAPGPAGGSDGSEGGCADALTVDISDTEILALGETCAQTDEDGTSHGDASALALLGNDVVPVSSDSAGGPASDAFDPLAPLCEGSGGAVCVQILYAESASEETADSSSSESHAALVFVCLGGSNPAPTAECDGVAQMSVGESHSSTSTESSTGGTTSDAEAQLLDVCIGGEDPASGFCSGVGVGLAWAESHSESPSSTSPGSASADSRPVSIEAGGEDLLGLTESAELGGPLCPTLLCLFVNQDETSESTGQAENHRQAIVVDFFGLPGVVEIDNGAETSASNPPRTVPAPRPLPPPPPPRPAPPPPLGGTFTPPAGEEPPPPVSQPSPEPTLSPTPSPTPVPTQAPPVVARVEERPHRTTFARSVPGPDEVDFFSGRTLVNLALALSGILILLFPGGLFNSTFEANYAEIQGWFAPIRRRLPTRGLTSPTLRRGVMVVSIVLITFLYGFLSPDFGPNRASVAFLLGILGAILAILVFGEIVSGVYLQRRARERMRLSVFPWAIFIAVMCVAISRLTSFEPGYLYGGIVVVLFAVTLPTDLDGKGVAITNAALLAAGLAAWSLWSPVRDAAASPDAGFPILVLDSFLVVTFVGALEGVLINMLPMRFLDGLKLLKWNKWVWAGLLLVSLFLFLHVLLSPGSGYIATSDVVPFFTMAALFVGFGLFSIAFWAYFRFRNPREEKEATEEPPSEEARAREKVPEKAGSGSR